jgi:hypothetical protein
VNNRLDITTLLQLCASSQEIRIQFVPSRVADSNMQPYDDICDFCSETFWDEKHDQADIVVEGYCTCLTSEMNFEQCVVIQEDQMNYMEVVQDLLSNNNEAWLNDIRNKNNIIKCSFAHRTNLVSFKILCAQPFGDSTTEYKGAWDLLEKWGVFDLQRKHQMDFIVAYEKEEQHKNGKYDMTSSVVHEIRIPRPSGST